MPKTAKTTKRDKYGADSPFFHDLERDITEFIKAGAVQPDTEDKFNRLSLRLFEYQYNTNEPYQKYCNKRGVKPGDAGDWKQIPYVATNAFKELPLCTFPPDEATKVFVSSGTTDPEKRSKVYLNQAGIDMLYLSLQKSVEPLFFTNPSEKLHTLLLAPTPDLLPYDAAMLDWPKKIIEGHHIGEPLFLIKREGLDIKFLVERLRQAEEDGEPILLFGTTFGYVHFFDYCLENGLTFKLPDNSRFLDGAGYKGRSRELTKEDFFELAAKVLGIEPHLMVNNYGMSELQVIFADNVLYNHIKGVSAPRHKTNPPWTRTLVVDPETLEPLPKGKQGLMRHYNLANMVTVQVLQSDDIGYETGTGFEVVGRAKGSESRVCSMTVEELISAQKA